MDAIWFIAATLATWRLTHLVVAEDGPWDVVVHLRRLAGNSPLGAAMDCFYCASLWVALPLAAWWVSETQQTLAHTLVAWPALSGGALLLERRRPELPTTQPTTTPTTPTSAPPPGP